MAAEIGPGTLLRCVKCPADVDDPPEARITVGAIYRIDRVVHDLSPCPVDDCGSTGYTLVERSQQIKCVTGFLAHMCPGHTAVYCPNCFVPLNDGDTSMVEDQQENPYDVPAPPVRICEEV